MKRDRRRREILQSAAALFRERGVSGVRMEEIAAGLWMTKGNLYYYFRNKDEILYFVQATSLDRLLTVSRRILGLRLPTDAKLRLMMIAHVRCLLGELAAAEAHIELHSLPASMRRRIISKRDLYERRWRRLIERGVREGVLAETDPKLAGMMILGALNWSARWYRPAGRWTPDEIAREMSARLMQGLLAKDRAVSEPGPELVSRVMR